MSPPDDGLTSSLRRWAGRAATVAGGVLLLNFLRPVPRQAAGETPDHSAAQGRGQPETPASAPARAAGHETEDMSGRTMSVLVATLGVTVACVIGGMVWLNSYLTTQRNDLRASLTSQQTTAIVPPAPNLQAAPLTEIDQLHAREDALLDHYTWLDKDHTRARIPIERALALAPGHTLDPLP